MNSCVETNICAENDLWDGTHQNVGFTFSRGFVKCQRQTVEICETEANKETTKSVFNEINK